MRIVVFSDLVPPLLLGGHEVGAALVLDELKQRGHELLLLSARDYFLQEGTSFRYACHGGRDGPPLLDTGLCIFGSVWNLLRTLPVRLLKRASFSLLTRRRYRRAVAAFRPERVLLFNPRGVVAPVLHDLVELARKAGAPVHAYIGDDWLARWPAANPLLRVLARLSNSTHPVVRVTGKALAATAEWVGWAPSQPPRVDRFVYCSDFVRRLSLSRSWGASSHEVVPWGLANGEKLSPPPADHFAGHAPLTLLFASRLDARKGLDVLLQALAGCRAKHHLVVLGQASGPHAQFCKRLVAELELAQRVHFLGLLTHAETLARLGKLGHVLVVPSVGDEPFGRVVLEGMALGLPVVASDGGGTSEVIRHGDTGFLFTPGVAAELTALLDRLEDDRELCGRIGARARRSMLQRFTIERMVDRLLGGAPALAPGHQAA